KRGDRVYTAQTLSGAYAEYALALEHQAHPVPAKISFSQGAGVWVPYGTAYHALYHSAKAHASETVLVHGASGGVGIAAVQIARSMGLMILGTAGTPTGARTYDAARLDSRVHALGHYLSPLRRASARFGYAAHQQTSTILPLAPGSRISLCARAA